MPKDFIDFNQKTGFICDMDGVIYHGNRLLPGVKEFVDWLYREEKNFLFLTNSSERSTNALQQKLRRMGLDYVDIFYHHRMDPNTPLEETMGALAQAVRSGKALYVGLSNYDGPTLEKATAILDELHVPFIINQNRYSIFDRTIENNGLNAMAARLHKGIITFSPLAQGLLTNRYLQGIPADSRVHTDGRFLKEKDITPEKIAQINALNDIAQARGQTLAEMALAWLLSHDEITTVLIGASKTSQILDNIKAVQNMSFTAEELEAIDRISK